MEIKPRRDAGKQGKSERGKGVSLCCLLGVGGVLLFVDHFDYIIHASTSWNCVLDTRSRRVYL